MGTSTQLPADVINDDQRANAARFLETLSLLETVNRLLVAFNFEPLTTVRPQQPTATPVQPAMVQPAMVQPAMVQPAMVQPAMVQPTTVPTPPIPPIQPIATVPVRTPVARNRVAGPQAGARHTGAAVGAMGAKQVGRLHLQGGMPARAEAIDDRSTQLTQGARAQQFGEALGKQDFDRLKKLYSGTTEEGITTVEEKKDLRQRALKNPQALLADLDFGSMVLSECKVDDLKDIDLEKLLGDKKTEVLGAAVLKLATKPGDNHDKEVFARLAGSIPEHAWNDKQEDNKTRLQSGKRGLAQKVCCRLWQGENFDSIGTLISKCNIDTHTAWDNGDGKTEGDAVYSGFVIPIQHQVGRYMKESHEHLTGKKADTNPKKMQGIADICKALDTRTDTQVLTSYGAVEKSPLIKDEFKNAPGTIWGFEYVRMPYVAAAHEDAKAGAQPIRMMELWDAVGKAFNQDTADALLKDPEGTSEAIVADVLKMYEGVRTADKSSASFVKMGGVETRIPETLAQMKALGDDKFNAFMANFKDSAKKFLLEYVTHMPKVEFVRQTKDPQSATEKISLSNLAGVGDSKFMSSFACKAGLWSAKEQKQPVYYCLDGINMEDVVNYKKLRNEAINAYLQAGGASRPKTGKSDDPKPHHEVVTFVEVREILKNWDELKDTVKFAVKGEMLQGDKLKTWLEEWQGKLKAADETEKKRTDLMRAPPKAQLAEAVAEFGIDVKNLPQDPEGGKIALIIARKAGYLRKVSRTKPKILLHYLMKKCQVLVACGMVPQSLPDAAAKLYPFSLMSKEQVKDPSERKQRGVPERKEDVENDVKALEAQINSDGCFKDFQDPFRTALVLPLRTLLAEWN